MIKISFRSNFPLLSSSSQKEAFCPRWVAFIVAEKISTFNRNWYPMFPFTKKMCLQNNQKTTRVFYSFLHVWWRGMIKKTWVSAQIEEKTTSTKQFDWEKTWVSPTHAQVGSHLILSASWSLSRGYQALPCWKHVVLVELKHLSWCFSSSCFFRHPFFSGFGKPSGSRIWNSFDLEKCWVPLDYRISCGKVPV